MSKTVCSADVLAPCADDDRVKPPPSTPSCMLGAAVIALLVVGWATSGGGAGKIGHLFDRVIDAVTGKLDSDRARPRRGQAAVELALCLPLLFMFLLGIVQLVVIVRDQLAVQLAAREAARAAAVAVSSDAAAQAAADHAVTLRPLTVATQSRSTPSPSRSATSRTPTCR